MNKKQRNLILFFWVLSSFMSMSAHATYVSDGCSACHGYTSSTLPNAPDNSVYTLGDPATAYNVRAANNPNYLDSMISTGDMTATLPATTVAAIVAEIGSGSGIAPVITSAAPTGGTYNVAYNKTVTATGKPNLVGNPGMGRTIKLKEDLTCDNIAGTYPGNFCYWDVTPQAFSVTSGALPPGLTINGSSGVISGTPTLAGTYTGNITANNMVGTSVQAFSIVIAKATQSITFGFPTLQTYSPGGTFVLSPLATASSLLAVSYSSTTPGVCTIAGTTITKLSAGTCTIAANQSGNANYSPASQVPRNITIAKAAQPITFGAQAGQTYSAAGTFPISPLATTPSTSPIVYSSTTPAVCTVSGTTVTKVAAGTCTIAANAVTDTNYLAATQVTKSLTIAKATQTITFPAQTAQSFSPGGTFALIPVATTPSTSPIVYSSTTPGVCTIAGSSVTTLTTGLCIIAANAAADTNYNVATQVIQNIIINPAYQTISVTTPAPASAAYNTTFPVAATASSGLTVAISVSGGCSIAAGTVLMTSPGSGCVVYFNQAGNANYSAATQVLNTVSLQESVLPINGNYKGSQIRDNVLPL